MPTRELSMPSLTVNEYVPHICEAKEGDVECFSLANIPHQLSAWPGHWTGGETVWLCKRHYNMLWAAALAAHEVRVQTREREQEKSA